MVKSIKVLGSDCCTNCTNLKNKIVKLVNEKSLSIEVEKIIDIVEIMKYGVMSAPAVVIDEKVKCSGRIPSDKELNDWIFKII